MHDARAAAAARLLSGMRCMLAVGIALCAVLFLSHGFSGRGALYALSGCILCAGMWWLLERYRQLLQRQPVPREPVASEPALKPGEVNDAGAAFLSAMGHDLRQPAQAAALFAATLSTHSLPEASRKLVKGIESAVEQLSEQLEAVFAIAKLESGRGDCKCGPLELNGLMAHAVSSHLDDAHERGLHLRHIRTRRRVMADSVLLGRALDRLVAHALRTTERGGVLLGCRQRGGSVVIEVWDSGVGVPADQIAEVFIPGGRHGQNLVDRGLGLVLAERSTRRMGGRLEVFSRPRRGSVMKLWLDAARK